MFFSFPFPLTLKTRIFLVVISLRVFGQRLYKKRENSCSFMKWQKEWNKLGGCTQIFNGA